MDIRCFPVPLFLKESPLPGLGIFVKTYLTICASIYFCFLHSNSLDTMPILMPVTVS